MNNKRIYQTAALILLLSAAPALYADSLAGRVLDPDGLAVASAKIQLFDRNSGEQRLTRSDREGAYEFSNLAPGNYLLEAEAPNASMAGSAEVVVRGDEAMDLQLAISGSEVEVIVTSSGTPLLLTEVAKAVDVIDSEEMSLRNEFGLAEALRTVPGLRVRQLRGPGSFTTIQTRGMRSQDTAVLIDGLRFRDAAGTQGAASGFLSDMLIVDTDRVEFLRGSGSSLYGSHAMAGVMNISSNQGGGRTHGEIRTEGGGLGMLRGVARIGGGLDDDRFVYSGGLAHLNMTDGYRGVSPHRNTSAQGFARYQTSQNTSLSGRLWASDVFLASADSPAFPAEVTANFPASGTVPAIAVSKDQVARYEAGLPITAGAGTFVPSPVDPDSRRVSSFLAGALIWKHELSPTTSYRLAYQGIDTNRSFQDGPAGPGSFEPSLSTEGQFNGRTDTFQARADHRAGPNHLLTVGYELERESYFSLQTDEGPSPANSEIEIDQSSHAVYGQDQVRLLDGRLQVSLSGRAQFFALGDPRFSGTQSAYEGVEFDNPASSYTGDAAIAYFVPSSGTKLRAHVGNSYRAPSSFERFGASFFSGFYSFYGDPRLDSERSLSFDAGVDQWLADSKARLSATIFYTDLSETILFDFANFPQNDPFGRFGGYINGGGGTARGVELSAEASPASSTRLFASYTFTNSESRTPRIGADFFGIPGQSDHIFSLTATQWVGRRFRMTFDLFAASEYSLSPFGAQGRRMIFDGPVKADVVFGYEVPLTESQSVEFYGKVENVFDNDYYENGFGSPGAWAIGGMKYSF